MTLPSQAALKLGGFLLARAFWVASELREGELYVPEVLCEMKDGNREIFVFEADTQLNAVSDGKDFLSKKAKHFDRCAFARDGEVNTSSGYVDVFIVDIVERDVSQKMTIIQPYSSVFKGHFQLLGNELLDIESAEITEVEAERAIRSIREGASEQITASKHWTRWDSERSKVNPLD